MLILSGFFDLVISVDTRDAHCMYMVTRLRSLRILYKREDGIACHCRLDVQKALFNVDARVQL